MLDRQAEQLRERELRTDEGRLRLTVLLAGSTGLFLCCAVWGVWSTARGVSESRRANERLRENEAALRLITDNATDLVRVVGPDSQLTYVSPSCEAILQYSPAEMFAMAPRTLMHPDEREAARELTLQVQRGERTRGPLVHRLRSKDGTYRWFETTYALVRSGDTDAPHIHLTSRDITARKSAEDSLRRQTARLHSILASIGDGVVVLDPDRRLAIVNPAARAYIYQEEGETVTDQGPLMRALRGESSAGTEVVIRDRRGTMRTFSISAAPIIEGEANAGGVAVYHDITQQRLGEKDLLESEQRMRVLAEATFEGVAITKAGVIIDTNETFAAWLGCQAFELVGVDGLSLFAPEDRAFVAEKSTQAGDKYEAHVLRRNGERFPVEVRGRHADFRGETVRIAVIRDITERRQRESELQRQAELLRTMSLRDELTGLLNRRGFQEHARQQLRLAGRTKRPAVVFFIDLNGMKVINDTLGHDAGDAALSQTAQILSTAFRESDIVARLGGDEFAIFAADCDADGAAIMRGRIDGCVDAFNEGDRSHAFRLSLAVGTAVFDPLAPLELDALLEAADHAMYKQKRARVESGTVARVQTGSGARLLG
jgi:diguanylate cyclase (GGDEF)-like protein/PAS domain S-box-containing protein